MKVVKKLFQRRFACILTGILFSCSLIVAQQPIASVIVVNSQVSSTYIKEAGICNAFNGLVLVGNSRSPFDINNYNVSVIENVIEVLQFSILYFSLSGNVMRQSKLDEKICQSSVDDARGKFIETTILLKRRFKYYYI